MLDEAADEGDTFRVNENRDLTPADSAKNSGACAFLLKLT